MLFLLPIAVPPVEESFEMSLTSFDVLYTLSEVSHSILEIHQPGMD